MSNVRNARRTCAQVSAYVRGSEKFVRLSHLRKLRECEQVAAVCYRMHRDKIEFLLVRTRGSGRWTFPKGNSEPGMTHAHAAALEAFEEAGVHGRIEEVSFARYFGRKRLLNSSARSAEKQLMIDAHLCEVLRLGAPKETNRKRTWFSIENARERLQEGRKRDEAAALTRVLAKAVERVKTQPEIKGEEIRQERDFFDRSARQRDPLNQVLFEPAAEAVSVAHRRLRAAELRQSSVPFADVQPRKLLDCEVLQFAAPHESNDSPECFSGKKRPKALSTSARG
jgi:8-oxo-dGTP pyrophosphatase MutT (NUDIX family)